MLFLSLKFICRIYLKIYISSPYLIQLFFVVQNQSLSNHKHGISLSGFVSPLVTYQCNIEMVLLLTYYKAYLMCVRVRVCVCVCPEFFG